MAVNFVQRGESVDYTPAAAKTGGDVVVQGDLVGVVTTDIAASTLGALQVEGVEEFPKSTGAGTALTAGQRVYWDATNSVASGDAGVGKFAGVVVTAAATTDSTVRVKLPGTPQVMGLIYSGEDASAAVSNTTTETAFDNAVTIPANTLKVGDILRVRLQAIATSTNSTDTLNIKLKLGSTVIVATGAVDVANNDIGYVDVDVVIRTIGASGTMVAAGVVALGVEGTVTAKPAKLASTAVDTTAAIVVQATATWSVASASNSVRMDVFNVQLISRS